jgi:hypothetical protein
MLTSRFTRKTTRPGPQRRIHRAEHHRRRVGKTGGSPLLPYHATGVFLAIECGRRIYDHCGENDQDQVNTFNVTNDYSSLAKGSPIKNTILYE